MAHGILLDMSHPYDASTKYLVETRLADWLRLCGRTTTAELQVIDADFLLPVAAGLASHRIAALQCEFVRSVGRSC
jgi:hypothetical protein